MPEQKRNIARVASLLVVCNLIHRGSLRIVRIESIGYQCDEAISHAAAQTLDCSIIGEYAVVMSIAIPGVAQTAYIH